jgi:hypothetical protein
MTTVQTLQDFFVSKMTEMSELDSSQFGDFIKESSTLFGQLCESFPKEIKEKKHKTHKK